MTFINFVLLFNLCVGYVRVAGSLFLLPSLYIILYYAIWQRKKHSSKIKI